MERYEIWLQIDPSLSEIKIDMMDERWVNLIFYEGRVVDIFFIIVLFYF
jgi:hypothetical protein